MILAIYKRALDVLRQKPLALWGISLLYVFLCAAAFALFGAIPGLALAIILLLNTAMTMIFLNGYRGGDVAALQLFDCFKDAATVKRVLGGMAWMHLWAFLWCLIPFAGPILYIIRLYEYRLTPYILVTEPEIRATEAMKVSSQRTNGWKGKMFCADFLLVLAVFVISMFLGLLSEIRYIGGLFGLILFVFTLCWGAVAPLFTGLVKAAFFEEIRNPTYVPKPRHISEPHSEEIVIEPQMMSFCPRCGGPLSPNTNFCTNCGQKLG